jgi:glyoxylase-like metal-dependent hydrolase (beta-lactamase superfamily II)
MRKYLWIVSRFCIFILVAAAGAAFAQDNLDWTEPFPPFRIAGNLYYVGSKGLANYLITTPQGNILINSDLEANVPLIEASIEKLGFKFKDTKILLISHAHWDHDAGSATIKEKTGASYMVMDADVSVVESGGKTDFQYGNSIQARQGRPRTPRWRQSEPRWHGARSAPHPRPHQRLHHLDDAGRRRP